MMALADLVRRYRSDGFVHAEGLLPAAEVEALRAAVDAAVARRKVHDTRALDEKSPYEQSFIQCQYLWEDCPDVRLLTFHPALGEAVGALLDAPRVRLWHDQALYKEAGGRETEAHQDHAYWPIVEQEDTITAWIPLAEVGPDGGCMGYVPGSHRAGLEFVDIFRTPGAGEALMQRQADAATFVPCRPGDVIFHHGRTVHMAKPNRTDRARPAYAAIFFKDGCRRSAGRAHPSVDRDAIPVGGRIDGPATPVTWPLAGDFPEPGPWPDDGQGRIAAYRRMGVIPDAPRAGA